MAKWGVESSIPSQYLLVLVVLAVERGCAPEQLFNNTEMSLDTLGSPGLRIDEVHAAVSYTHLRAHETEADLV